MQNPPKKPLMSPSEKHKIELMIIILIVTVIGNVVIYYFNKKHEEATSKQIAAQIKLTPTAKPPTATPVASPSAAITDCKPFKSGVFDVCVPNSWIVAKTSATGTRFEPKSIKTDPSVNYLTITLDQIPVSPLPTPLKTYTAYKSVEIGDTTGFRTDYIPQKNKDGFVVPLPGGCQDPYEILVSSKKRTIRISSCKQYEQVVQPLLDSFTVDN